MTNIQTSWDPKKGLHVEVDRQLGANNRLRKSLHEQKNWLHRRGKHDTFWLIVTMVILTTILMISIAIQ